MGVRVGMNFSFADNAIQKLWCLLLAVGGYVYVEIDSVVIPFVCHSPC